MNSKQCLQPRFFSFYDPVCVSLNKTILPFETGFNLFCVRKRQKRFLAKRKKKTGGDANFKDDK